MPTSPTRLDDLPEVLLVEDVALVLRMSTHAVYHAIRRGQIPAVRIGARWKFSREAIRRLMDRGEA